jgi:hypothetical protein
MMSRFFLLLLVLALAACRPPEPASATAATAASTLAVRVEPERDPTLVGATPIAVYVLQEGAGVSGAAVRVTGDMTHAGMVPVIADAVETEPGLYRAEAFTFSMAGDWILTADVTLPDGRRLEAEARVTVPQ